MKIEISANTLCTLCAPHFTLEACEAIEQYIDDCGCDEAFRIGDICLSFAEVPADWKDDYDEDCILAELDNGNIVVLQ